MNACTDRNEHLLNEMADGELDGAHRAALEAHLSGCDACRGELVEILELREQARALPTSVQPPRDLWPGIEARLQRRVIELPTARTAHRPGPRGPRFAWEPRRLAMAATVALVALTSGLGAYWLGARSAASPTGGPTAAAPATPAAGLPAARPATALAAWQPTERQYQGVVEQLQVELDAGRGLLAPETVATIEQNLQIIDAAIAEARAALEADPASVRLPLMLSDIYRKKVELLQHAVQLQRST